jgi:hypothetical protein
MGYGTACAPGYCRCYVTYYPPACYDPSIFKCVNGNQLVPGKEAGNKCPSTVQAPPAPPAPSPPPPPPPYPPTGMNLSTCARLYVGSGIRLLLDRQAVNISSSDMELKPRRNEKHSPGAHCATNSLISGLDGQGDSEKVSQFDEVCRFDKDGHTGHETLPWEKREEQS